MVDMPTTQTHIVHRQRNRFVIWAWSPIIVLRVALFLQYALYAYASVIAFIVGVPIFDLTTPRGYTAVWAILLGLSAIVSAIGAITERWNALEKWSSLALSALMLTFVGAVNLAGFVEGDLNEQFVGAISLIAVVLPFCRFVYLAAQTGKKRLTDVVSSGKR